MGEGGFFLDAFQFYSYISFQFNACLFDGRSFFHKGLPADVIARRLMIYNKTNDQTPSIPSLSIA